MTKVKIAADAYMAYIPQKWITLTHGDPHKESHTFADDMYFRNIKQHHYSQLHPFLPERTVFKMFETSYLETDRYISEIHKRQGSYS